MPNVLYFYNIIIIISYYHPYAGYLKLCTCITITSDNAERLNIEQ